MDTRGNVQGRDRAERPSRRRWLLGAAALPAALMLPGCGARLPFLGGHEPGQCLPPTEELPEEVHDTDPPGVVYGGMEPSAETWFRTDALAVSPDGSLLAAYESFDRVALDLAEASGVILWDTASGEVVRRIDPPATGAIAWHPDGTRLAVADDRFLSIIGVEGDLQWNLIGHERPRDGFASIPDVAFSPDGTLLASSSSDGTVRLWDVSGESCGAGHILTPGPRTDGRVSFSPDGGVLAVGGTTSHTDGDSDNPPELWDPATGRDRRVLDDIEGIVFEIGHSGDGSLLVLTHEPDSLTVIAPDGELSEGPVPESTWFADMAVGPGSRVAMHSDGTVLVWDRDSGEETLLEDVELDQMRWSPDERTLYTLHRETGVTAWDGSDWRQFALP